MSSTLNLTNVAPKHHTGRIYLFYEWDEDGGFISFYCQRVLGESLSEALEFTILPRNENCVTGISFLIGLKRFTILACATKCRQACRILISF